MLYRLRRQSLRRPWVYYKVSKFWYKYSKHTCIHISHTYNTTNNSTLKKTKDDKTWKKACWKHLMKRMKKSKIPLVYFKSSLLYRVRYISYTYIYNCLYYKYVGGYKIVLQQAVRGKTMGNYFIRVTNIQVTIFLYGKQQLFNYNNNASILPSGIIFATYIIYVRKHIFLYTSTDMERYIFILMKYQSNYRKFKHL